MQASMRPIPASDHATEIDREQCQLTRRSRGEFGQVLLTSFSFSNSSTATPLLPSCQPQSVELVCARVLTFFQGFFKGQLLAH
jgi:hypothetical protein